MTHVDQEIRELKAGLPKAEIKPVTFGDLGFGDTFTTFHSSKRYMKCHFGGECDHSLFVLNLSNGGLFVGQSDKPVFNVVKSHSRLQG